MSEMFDRVARTIYDALLEKGGGGRTMVTWDYAPERPWCIATALMVILAMREPTEEMWDAHKLAEEVGISHWHAMIDRILE